MANHGHSHASGVRQYQTAMRLWNRKWSFLASFVFFFAATAGILGVLDLLPNGAQDTAQVPSGISASASLALAETEQPSRIEAPSIGLDVTVSNPTSTDVPVLDKALLSGAVRYPTSAKLGETGNVIVFGHSSYLPIVHNQAYKAFDGIQKLKAGDKVLVTGTSRTFVYQVESVLHANASQDSIPLTVSGSKLTLATCDSFGTKSDRFIVTANLVESYPVGN